jgi:outer membrane protein assembly factor BamB
MPKVPSMIYVAPFLYTITDGGVATCLEGATGDVVWQRRIGGSFSASPVAAEGRIYLLSDEGQTTVIAAGPEFQVLATNPLNEKVQASMAVSNKRLFIRTAGNLYCIGESAP